MKNAETLKKLVVSMHGREGETFPQILGRMATAAMQHEAPILQLCRSLDVSRPTLRKWLIEAGLLEAMKGAGMDNRHARRMAQ